MQKELSRLTLLLALVLAAPLSIACDEAPDAMMNAVTAEVMSILRHDKDLQAGSPAKVAELIETRIQPLFDFARMTRIAAARSWRLATPEQQSMLTAEFKTLLVRTYFVALANYRDQAIEFKRLRMAPGDTVVKVKSEVSQPGRERIAIDYDMERTGADWKIYDIKVGGVSLIATYRETFAEAVRDEGLDGLIKSLSDKNRQASAAIKPARTTFWDQTRLMFAMLQSALQGRRQ
ncbi:MAG: ABC transporter substrate-binding protein [Betaproteobacteria bacterium]|nr:ABC transporter substrate-binding protein [Betaproteobacteria bacterium]